MYEKMGENMNIPFFNMQLKVCSCPFIAKLFYTVTLC